MAHDFELRRLTEKMKKLTEEQSRVNRQILKSRRDEQSELDYVRRRFNLQIHSLEDKQHKIAKDMTTYERQLDALEKKMDKEKEDQEDDFQNRLKSHGSTYRRTI